MPARRASAGRWFVAAIAAGACTLATAKGHLQARPTMVELAPQAAAGRLMLANSGDAPVAAQVRVFAWEQVDGEDRLTPAKDVVLSPPIARIAPGGEQVVRLVRTGPAASGRDRTYRIVVDELPGDPTSPSTAISVRLQYVLPLFVRAAGAAPPALACRLAAANLVCRNAGGQPAQLGKSGLVDGAGHALALSAGLFGYVLPGSERRWAVDATRVAALDGGLHLDTQLNGQGARLDVARTP
jgi:fimbrial chaperone protein